MPTATPLAAEAREANLPADVELPTCDVAGEPVNTGERARCFAEYMRVHALETTEGRTYAEMGRFLARNGEGEDGIGGTNDEAQAVVAGGRPVDNPRRQVWVTETALSTALNTAFFAEQVADFSIIMGIALLLTGIGFLVLTIGGALRRRPGAPPAPA